MEHLVKANKWNGHQTDPTAGFMCTGVRQETVCEKGFFGGESVNKDNRPFTPDITKCRDAYDRDGHAVLDEHPYPNCVWLSTRVVSHDTIEIVPLTIEYDPFQDTYRDHSLSKGICSATPCLSAARDGYWFNTTNPKKSCQLPQPIELAFQARPSGPVGTLSFMSLSLQASSFKGSCRLEMCGANGVKLNTNEWITAPTLNLDGVPKCVDRNPAVNLLTNSGMMLHLAGLLQHDESVRECQRVKRQLMMNATISRSDLTLIRPVREGPGPVYKVSNGTLWVAKAQYDILHSMLKLPVQRDGKLERLSHLTASHLMFFRSLWKNTQFLIIHL